MPELVPKLCIWSTNHKLCESTACSFMACCHVSHNLKCCIHVLRLELGFSVKEICKILGICKSLVYQTLWYHFIYGTTSNPLFWSHCGPWKLTSIDIAFICNILGQQHTTYLDEIQDKLISRHGTLVSILTLAQTLCWLDFSHKRVSAKTIKRNELLHAAFMNKIGTEVPHLQHGMNTQCQPHLTEQIKRINRAAATAAPPHPLSPPTTYDRAHQILFLKGNVGSLLVSVIQNYSWDNSHSICLYTDLHPAHHLTKHIIILACIQDQSNEVKQGNEI